MLIRDKSVRRRGSILPLAAVSLTALMGLIALGVDLGMLTVARTQCQNAADLAALAGCRELNGNVANNNLTAAQAFANTIATDNSVLSVPLVSSQITVTTGVYSYNSTSQQFTANFSGTKTSTQSWTAMQVQVSTSQPTYFARVFGLGPIAVGATAVAVHRPRDLAIVLDFSTSMQYGSNVNIRGVNESTTDPTAGSMNPDPNYPQFGPWSIFQASSVSAGNPNPMMCLDAYGDLHGESHAPSNLTIATTNGPPMVGDYLYDSGGSYVNAFVVGNPASYSASLTPVVTPTPTSSWLSAPVDGDPWPLKNGKTSAASPTDYAGCVEDYLGQAFKKSTNAVDSGFNTSGYDYNYNTATKKWQTTAGRFKGYTVGPGYYGKTFYMWPPDPRTPVSTPGQAGYVAGDWRQRFFGTNNNTVLWNSSGTWIQNGGTINYTNVLAWLTSGPQTLPPNLQSGRIVYYSSIPANVNSYTSNLDQRFWKEYIDFVLGYNSETSTYNPINMLYGQNSSGSPSNQPNGGNGFGSYTFGPTPAITSPPASSPPYMSYTDAPVHPRLHFWFGPLTMMAFLVGQPEYGRNWNPGTSHEAHDWQLKAGIQSAITDLQNNHPNDQASLIYFSTLDAYNTARVPMGQNYTYLTNALWYPYSLVSPTDGSVSGTVRPYDVNFNDLSQGVIPTANGGTDSSAGLAAAYNQLSSNTSQGFTGRAGAVKMVLLETDGVTHDWYTFSMQSNGAWNSYLTFNSGNDEGVNSTLNSPSKTATYSMATQLCASTTANPPGYSTARQPARIHCMAFGELIEPAMTNNATAGPMQQCVLEFLLQIQQNGNTSPSTDTIQSCWGYPGTPTAGGDGVTPASGGYTTGTQSFKIIVGGYQQRINLIQQAMSRIMQSGVQIALIQ